MSIDTKIRLLHKDEHVRVLVLVNHPMQSGDGQAANYIEHMVFEQNGDRVAEMRLGPGVYSDPQTGIVIEPVDMGDRIDVRWFDNRGGSGAAQATVK